MPSDRIVVRGAREHNLKNVDVEMPRDQLIVITGLSGSGKSSLAFDTIYAEGQRRYVESLSAYARQFLGQMEKPDVDQIDGLSPAISIDQKGASQEPAVAPSGPSPRSTTTSASSSRASGACTARSAAARSSARRSSRWSTRSTRCRRGRGSCSWRRSSRIARASTRSCSPARSRPASSACGSTAQLRDLDEDIKLDKKYKHSIDVVVDRLVVRQADDDGNPRPDASRMADSIETALRLSEGILLVNLPDAPPKEQDRIYSEKYACPEHGGSFEEPAPRNFSFNSPHGACPDCTGLGSRLEIDPDLVLPNDELSVDEGAILPWRRMAATESWFAKILDAVAEHYGFRTDVPGARPVATRRGRSCCTATTASGST